MMKLRKTAIGLAVAVAATVGVAGVAAATHTFPNVPDDHRWHDSIEWAESIGLIKGKGNGNFGFNENLRKGHATEYFSRYDTYVQGVIAEAASPPAGAWLSGEDVVTALVANQRATVGSLDPGEGSHMVVAAATVSSGSDNDNMLCWLVEDGQDIAAGNAKALRESFTLTAIVDGPVELQCRTTEADGTATDVSITSVEVAVPGAE